MTAINIMWLAYLLDLWVFFFYFFFSFFNSILFYNNFTLTCLQLVRIRQTLVEAKFRAYFIFYIFILSCLGLSNWNGRQNIPLLYNCFLLVSFHFSYSFSFFYKLMLLLLEYNFNPIQVIFTWTLTPLSILMMKNEPIY